MSKAIYVSLLPFFFPQNVVTSGEDCLLLDNSEHHAWKVNTNFFSLLFVSVASGNGGLC